MDKYAQYIKERENSELYEDSRGFFTYKILGKFFQVDDLFILPEERNKGNGKDYSKIIEKVAKEEKCDTIYCTTCKQANNWITSHLYIMKHGYKKIKEDENLVYYMKEL